MFTQEELLAKLPRLMEQDALPMERVEFLPEDFDSSSSEENIVVDRGLKMEFESALQFWVQSLRTQDLAKRQDYILKYARTGKCTQMIAADFDHLIKEYSYSLKTPISLAPKSKFISAMQMYDDWNDIALLAEFEQEYIAFYWATTA